MNTQTQSATHVAQIPPGSEPGFRMSASRAYWSVAKPTAAAK
jgi:hypothetical protein